MKLLNTTWIVRYGRRWQRLFTYPAGGFRHFFLYRSNASILHGLGYWMVDLALLLADVGCLPELYLGLERILLPVKPLRENDGIRYRIPFPGGISMDAIRLHPNPKIKPNPRVRAYVSFHTINYWGDLDRETFLHEMIHIWQFDHVGSIYIHHALRAQRMVPAYEYGLLSEVLDRWETVRIWADFNFEQMASLGADLLMHLQECPDDTRAKAILDQFF